MEDRTPSTSGDPGRWLAGFEKVRDLGRGAFGFVQLMRHTRTGELLAVKFLERVRHEHSCGPYQHPCVCSAKEAVPAMVPAMILSTPAVAPRLMRNQSIHSYVAAPLT